METEVLKKLTTKLMLVGFSMALTCNLALAGGTTGGGGNIPIQEQVRDNYYLTSIRDSKPILMAWLQHEEANYKMIKEQNKCEKSDDEYNSDCEIYTKLFDGPVTIYQILDQTQIEARSSGPCLDYEGNPNDGSVIGKKAGSICISVSNIKVKLREDNYQNQVAALILHELSHLAGADEVQAQRLQWIILSIVFSDTPAGAFYTKGHMADYMFNQKLNATGIFFSEFKNKTDLNGKCSKMNPVMTDMINLYYDELSLGSGSGFLLLSQKESEMFWGATVKFRAAWNYLCGKDMTLEKLEREMAASIYEYAFQNRDQVTAVEYGGGWSEDSSSDVILKRITSKVILDSELDEVYVIYKKILLSFRKNLLDSTFVFYQ